MPDLPYPLAKRILETGGLRAVDYARAGVIGDGDLTHRPIFEEAACVVADFERGIRASRAALPLYRLWCEGYTYREVQRLTGMDFSAVRKKIIRFVKNKCHKAPSPCNTVRGGYAAVKNKVEKSRNKCHKVPSSCPTGVEGDVLNGTDSASDTDGG